MGLAYTETGFLDEAIDTFKKVIDAGKNEKTFAAYIMLGVTQREKGLFSESLKNLREASGLPDLSPEMKFCVFFEIAQTFKTMNDLDRAFFILKELQKDDKNFLAIEKITGISFKEK
jgi:lipopolysaccharide biosynthesis regulator YciM